MEDCRVFSLATLKIKQNKQYGDDVSRQAVLATGAVEQANYKPLQTL